MRLILCAIIGAGLVAHDAPGAAQSVDAGPSSRGSGGAPSARIDPAMSPRLLG